MPKLKNNDIVTKLVKLGLNKNQLEIFLKYVDEPLWNEAVKIYKKLNVIRKESDTKDVVYALLKIGKASFDVNLEVIDNELVSFCNCNHRDTTKACEHAGAILIEKMLKEKENDFNSKLKITKETKKENNLQYFKNLYPAILEKDKKDMIYFNFEDFTKFDQVFKIERGVVKKDGSFGISQKFHAKNFDLNRWKISKKTRKVLEYVSGGDTYGLNYSRNGFVKDRFYDTNTDLMMPVLRDLYFEERDIILGAIFSNDKFQITWDITKIEDNKYEIEPFFVAGKRKRSLTKINLTELGLTTLWVFDNKNRCFYKGKHDTNLSIIREIINNPKKLTFTELELRKFFKDYYQKILNEFELNVSNDLKKESKSVNPRPKLYLEKSGMGIDIKLKFDYMGREVSYFSTNKELVVIENDIIYDISRDFECEEEIVEFLNDHMVVTDEEKDEFILEGELIDFVSTIIPKLLEEGIAVLGEDKLFDFKISKSRGLMNLEIKQESDWFDFKGTVKFGEETVNIKDVLEALFQNKRFISLGNNKKAIIPKEWINKLQTYSGFFNIGEDDVKLSKNHVAVLEVINNLASKSNMAKEVKRAVDMFKNFNKIKPKELSKKLKAELRPYQKAGFDWLNFLQETGWNGVLADDMGLGKTVQALSILQTIKDSRQKNPFLVIVPTSLVFNWANEIEKFTPEMNYHVHHGQNRLNKKNFKNMAKKTDIIITTYGVLRNDLEILKQINFEYLILDEAHVIKNPQSIAAKSVCELSGKNKLVISGTPIQNNLGELWSLFNFLNPGYLGSFEFFREKFVLPIEKDHNKDASDSLRKLINPFLLRRTKTVIADELPEKTEIILKSNFNEDERALYNNWKEFYRHEIRGAINEKGINSSKMKILEGLTKLRQICLHPKLVDSEYTGKSAKFDLLIMELEKILAEGHKVLIFSSFVKMLKVVKGELEKRGLRYSYLDGATVARQKVVEKFQESEKPRAFLISIKAGGLGLNLTRADYVFILDPWWNPAVETQAMDRAHRIGQDKKVFVYKMIAENTIEEKILKLQKSKKKLSEDLIVEEQSLIKNINLKDIDKIFS